MMGTVETDRMILRPFEPSDLDALATVFAKPEVWEFPHGGGFTRAQTSASLDRQLEHWEVCGFGCWLAELRESVDQPDANRVIGYVGLSIPLFLPTVLPAVEVGWRFDPDVWGRGLATEGARAALAAGFGDLGLEEICSLPESANVRSVRVAERLGMQNLGTVAVPANERFAATTAEHFSISR